MCRLYLLRWFYNRKTPPLLEDVYPPSQQRKIVKRPNAKHMGIASAEILDTADRSPSGVSAKVSPELMLQSEEEAEDRNQSKPPSFVLTPENNNAEPTVTTDATLEDALTLGSAARGSSLTALPRPPLGWLDIVLIRDPPPNYDAIRAIIATEIAIAKAEWTMISAELAAEYATKRAAELWASYQPLESSLPVPTHEIEPASLSTGQNTRYVTSVSARITDMKLLPTPTNLFDPDVPRHRYASELFTSRKRDWNTIRLIEVGGTSTRNSDRSALISQWAPDPG